MKRTYDKEANAVYIYIDQSENKEVDSTDGEWPFNVDLDKDGNVIGIEVMDANTIFTSQYLESMEQL